MVNNKRQDLDKEINAITIKIKRGSWEIFKAMTPRNITLNQAVVQLINKEIDKNSRPATEEEQAEFFSKKKKGRPENRYEVTENGQTNK